MDGKPGGLIVARKMTMALGFAALVLVPAMARAEPNAYSSPEAAVDAVIAALEAQDREALLAVFGAENEDVIFTGEEPRDREIWTEFLGDYRALHRVAVEEEGSAILSIGTDQWPFPAPIIAGDNGWIFDAAAAREEVLDRRIGENELDVIALLGGYVRAQADYRRTDYNGDGVMAFAASILSDAGARDGLYWPDTPGVVESPVGDFMARAAAEGYSLDGADVAPEPYLGYYYRVLTGQGPAAAGGAMDYRVNGHMMAGHALLAFPAAYGETGIMSFMVSEAGIIYEADLGEDTLEGAAAITLFDPGEDWGPVTD